MARIRAAASDGDELARCHDGLPVYADMGGHLLLRSDLSVVVVLHDGTRTEATTRDTLLARVLAAERFPELATLRPVVGEERPRCVLCEGSGVVGVVRCGRCLGLGRVPEGMDVDGGGRCGRG